MHPLLRTLDLKAGAGLESSVHDLHPIGQAAPPRSRGGPLLFSLGLTPLLIYGLSLSLLRPTDLQAARRALDQATRSVAFLLQEQGPREPASLGHLDGTSTRDPRLAVVQATTRSQPTEPIDPEELGPSSQAERVGLSLDPALPVQAGGNGLARGSGREATRGSGGAPLWLGVTIPVKAPDFKLIATHRVEVNYQMAPGEEYLLSQPIQVKVSIGEDGVPFQASLVFGPERLREKALRAALAWRFEPLGAHGLRAPQALTITFRRPR